MKVRRDKACLVCTEVRHQTSAFKRDNKMKIDRHNYEEFFILYWDNELPASQKQAVENFVKENSDLQEEFKILGETRFVPDDNVQFAEKEFLQNKFFINITNYEEHLLNYIDDELDNNEKKEVEKLAIKLPVIQKELLLLQKTKLQPETEITFPGKSTLYRREEKVRVISMVWLRVAVAAAIILIAGFVTLRLINTDNAGDNIEVAKNSDPKNQPSDQKTDAPAIQPVNQEKKDQKESLATIEKKSSSGQTPEKTSKKPAIENKVPAPLISKAENKNNLPITQQKTDNNKKTFIASVEIPKDNNKAAQISESEIISTPLGNSSVTKSSTLTFAIMDDDDFEKEKGGLKEFLRKTTRVFERRTKIQTTTEDNKLLLGAFAVSLK